MIRDRLINLKIAATTLYIKKNQLYEIHIETYTKALLLWKN